MNRLNNYTERLRSTQNDIVFGDSGSVICFISTYKWFLRVYVPLFHTLSDFRTRIDVVNADYFQVLYFFEISTSKWNTISNANGLAGSNGLDGSNRQGLKLPAASKSFENVSFILSDYIDYVNASKRETIQESFSDGFLKDLNDELISAKPRQSIKSALIHSLGFTYKSK